MLFNKNKKTNNTIPVPPAQFKREKLSAESLDHYAEAYQEKDATKMKGRIFDYTKLDGTQIKIPDSKIFTEDETALTHFEYLLGQTLPYHQPNDPKHLSFYLKDLMYIVDKNGKPAMWTDKKTHIVQFIRLAEFQDLLSISDLGKYDPKNPRYNRMPGIKPVIHEEKEHPAPGEE